ncbi:MAG: hypothetical protein IPI78_18165, partial [Chitinophagaceae bacterium]|nr:hypothetical protein [Chitinophagaceae bacterium]
ALFAEYGLIVLKPDSCVEKELAAVFEDDLLNQTASDIVEKSIASL